MLALSLSVVASVLFGVSKSGRLSLLDFFRSFFINDHRFEPFCLPQISSNEDAKSFLALRINAVTRFRCARYFFEFSSVGCIFDKWNSRLFNFHHASQCSFTMQADILSELSKWSRPAACSDVPAALTAKRKDSHFIACRWTDVDMFCKGCLVVQAECEGVPWKTEQKKREDKDGKKRS